MPMLQRTLTRSLNEYGMAVVLVLLCVYYSWATLERRSPVGAAAGRDTATQALADHAGLKSVAVVAGQTDEDRQFVGAAAARLKEAGVETVVDIDGQPSAARRALGGLVGSGAPPGAILATASASSWLPGILEKAPGLAAVPVVSPQAKLWPTFLLASNLINVTSQIAVIAVIAVGMTMVIITGGIDLSVGSLVALSAVLAARFIRDHAGGASAGTGGMIACGLAAVLICGLVGAFSGSMITLFKVPPFIATLAVMQIASGMAYEMSSGESIYDIPQSFTWLGQGTGVLGVPNAVWLMFALFVAAHVMMAHTRLGRYVYAVGGNAEAARLSGVRVGPILMTVYVLSGMAAGLGGVISASQLKGGAPTYGTSYELYVIAAVVVGGTSLSGGEGKIFGTLIGALIIAVIQNGMNLTGVGSYRQKVVLGFVILVAVLIDGLKRRPWKLPYFLRPAPATVAGSAPRVHSPAVGESKSQETVR